MGELIQNVEIVDEKDIYDYKVFKLRQPNGKTIILDRCRATFNFKLIPMPNTSLVGYYEVISDDKTLHQKEVVLHIYPNRQDLLLK